MLRKLRSGFIDSVSKEVVLQLLDNLLDKEVLNLEELETINIKITTANKARDLIDTVMSKGDEASNILILHLQKREPGLYEHLCQTCGSAAKPGEPVNLPIYPVTSNSIKNRVALLITNITFADEKNNRRGAEKDEENMKELLSTLGYEVVKHTNLTAKKMEDALVEFSKHPKLKETDSVFVVIMSHGKLGAVHGVNYEPNEPDELRVDKIYDKLNAENCPALVNKPKIIIIQACRGKERGSVCMSDIVKADAVHCGVTKEDVSRFTHKEMDFISLLSSTPHTVSYRNKSQGSYLIQFTVDVFKTNVLEDHIEDLFRKVMKKFKEEKELPDHLRQMPTKDRCTLTQHFFLFPGDLKQ
uniref:Caspase-1 n=1 Tax=Neogobius melanostomus TaxID=47308 RepID=A0A8C6T7N0_9GOBI